MDFSLVDEWRSNFLCRYFGSELITHKGRKDANSNDVHRPWGLHWSLTWILMSITPAVPFGTHQFSNSCNLSRHYEQPSHRPCNDWLTGISLYRLERLGLPVRSNKFCAELSTSTFPGIYFVRNLIPINIFNHIFVWTLLTNCCCVLVPGLTSCRSNLLDFIDGMRVIPHGQLYTNSIEKLYG